LLDEIVEVARENMGEILLCTSIVFYMLGLLNLTILGSPLFLVLSYAGSILLTSGSLIKLELLPKKLISLRGLSIALIFGSALLFTTAVNVMFLDVDMIIKIYKIFPISSPRGDVFDLPGPELYPTGGPKTTLIRPYAWLFSPCLTVGIILAIASLIIMLLS
jgi:hypothetical protein